MIHAGKLGRDARGGQTNFIGNRACALAYSPRVATEKQCRHRREPAARLHHVGRQQRRHQVAGRPVAAHLDRRHPLCLRRTVVAGGVALHFLARRIPAVDCRFAPAIVAARRVEPRGVHRRFQLGLPSDRGFARGALYRRVAGLDVVVGGTAATDVGQRAALRGGVAGAGRRAGPVLAGVANAQDWTCWGNFSGSRRAFCGQISAIKCAF